LHLVARPLALLRRVLELIHVMVTVISVEDTEEERTCLCPVNLVAWFR